MLFYDIYYLFKNIIFAHYYKIRVYSFSLTINLIRDTECPRSSDRISDPANKLITLYFILYSVEPACQEEENEKFGERGKKSTLPAAPQLPRGL